MDAIYTKADDTMIITGDVVMEQDKNVIERQPPGR